MCLPRYKAWIIGVTSSLCLVSHAFVPPSRVISPCLRTTGYVPLCQTGRYQGQSRPGRRTPSGGFQLLNSVADDEGPGRDGESPEDPDGSVVTEAVDDGATVEFGNAETRSKLKARLIRTVATLNRGFVAKESDRVDIEEIIEMLEVENPSPKPCEGFRSQSSPIAGTWRLLYTTSLDVLSLQVNPAVTIGQIFQSIESDGRFIQNIIELQPPFAAVSNRILGNSLATLTVKLESEPVSDTRINLKFVRTEIKANSVFGQQLDLPSLGVDIPSGDSLQKILERGQARIRGASKKAKEAAENLKRQGSKVMQSKDDVDVANGDSDEDSTPDSTSTSTSTSASSILKPYFETTFVDDDLRIGRTGSGDLYVSARL